MSPQPRRCPRALSSGLSWPPAPAAAGARNRLLPALLPPRASARAWRFGPLLLAGFTSAPALSRWPVVSVGLWGVLLLCEVLRRLIIFTFFFFFLTRGLGLLIFRRRQKAKQDNLRSYTTQKLSSKAEIPGLWDFIWQVYYLLIAIKLYTATNAF